MRRVLPPLVALLLAAAPLSAQRLGGILQANYGSKIEAAGIGGGVAFPWGNWGDGKGLQGTVTFDWFFPEDVTVGNATSSQTYWEFNINALRYLRGADGLFAGAGLNYTSLSVDGDQFANSGNTALGLNVLAGLKLGARRGAPFVQVRGELGGGKQIVVSGGVQF